MIRIIQIDTKLPHCKIVDFLMISVQTEKSTTVFKFCF